MAITIDKLQLVMTEIRRLERAISELRKQMTYKEKNPEFEIWTDKDGYPCLDQFPAQTGSVRRASMDLTRALAVLRNSKI